MRRHTSLLTMVIAAFAMIKGLSAVVAHLRPLSHSKRHQDPRLAARHTTNRWASKPCTHSGTTTPDLMEKVANHVALVQEGQNSLPRLPGHAYAADGTDISMVYVNVYFHVIRANMTTVGGNVNQKTVNKQVAAFNEYFNQRNAMNFTFRLQETTYTTNPSWFIEGGQNGSPEELAMKKQLRRGGCADLNVYTVFAPMHGTADAYSGMPSTCKEAMLGDGITMDVKFLVDSPVYGGMKGTFATHEAGHWCGLFHPFEGGCSYPNDHVADTNPQKEPSYDCAPKSTCGGVGYADDHCKFRFTPGQAVFAHKNWQAYRKSNYTGP